MIIRMIMWLGNPRASPGLELRQELIASHRGGEHAERALARAGLAFRGRRGTHVRERHLKRRRFRGVAAGSRRRRHGIAVVLPRDRGGAAASRGVAVAASRSSARAERQHRPRRRRDPRWTTPARDRVEALFVSRAHRTLDAAIRQESGKGHGLDAVVLEDLLQVRAREGVQALLARHDLVASRRHHGLVEIRVPRARREELVGGAARLGSRIVLRARRSGKALPHGRRTRMPRPLFGLSEPSSANEIGAWMTVTPASRAFSATCDGPMIWGRWQRTPPTRPAPTARACRWRPWSP